MDQAPVFSSYESVEGYCGRCALQIMYDALSWYKKRRIFCVVIKVREQWGGGMEGCLEGLFREDEQ
jgi:hypothetical protein